VDSNAAFAKVREALAKHLPVALVDSLINSYREMKGNYYLEKHEPSELNGGKFVESCIRILQQESTGKHTAIGTQIVDIIGKLRDMEKLPTNSLDETFRIHIPRVLVVIYNIRNKRGVGHLGGDVNPNRADAALLVACADWIMAELFRKYYSCTLEEAQAVVDVLVERQLLLVHDREGVRRVLLPSLNRTDQVLLLLTSEYPEPVSEESLLLWLEVANRAEFRRRVLAPLHAKRLIEFDKRGNCAAMPTGVRYVEANYPRWLDSLNRRVGVGK
jgi:hypothetical protein